MAFDLKEGFSKAEIQSIDRKLNEGVSIRASYMVFILSFLFSSYGVFSSAIISKYDSSITLWGNTWPRIVFNGIPFILLGLYLRKPNVNPMVKNMVWAVTQPIIFVAACMVHVWPIMYSGKLEIYPYFHAANIFVMTFGLTIIAPPRSVLITHLLSYVVIFLIPLLYITRADSIMSSMIVNDFLVLILGASVATYLTSRLHKQVALMDGKIKAHVTPLLGGTITSAIYTGSFEKLNNRKVFGLVLSMDLRGYTEFMHHHPRALTSAFMKDYHFLITTVVGKHNGFVHKSAGDGHLISFGLMDGSADLSDLHELQYEVIEAELKKTRSLAEIAAKMFDELIEKYDQLLKKHGISDGMRIGAALAAGNIEIQILGNENYRQEVNIDGDTIVRSSRLESYTKYLMRTVAPNSSMLIISPEIIDNLKSEINVASWHINDTVEGVRSFPEIKRIYYQTWTLKKAKLSIAS